MQVKGFWNDKFIEVSIGYVSYALFIEVVADEQNDTEWEYFALLSKRM